MTNPTQPTSTSEATLSELYTAERGQYMVDELGFVEQRCPHCNAHMYPREDGGGLICLNACLLPGYLYRLLLNGTVPE